MKGKKGITLIALIITIIVMVILAGVAISMAVGENGVISRGEKANATMEKKEIEETIQTSYYYDKYNAGKLDCGETKDAIEKNLEAAGYTVSIEGTDFPLTVTATGKTGTYTYVIEQEGKVEDKEIIVGEPLEIIGKYYYLSHSLEIKDGGIAILTQDGNNFETTYTYNASANIVEIMGQEFTYIKNGNNKMLRCDDSDEYMYLYTTAGTDSFARPENATYVGTYEENGTSYQVKVVIEDGKINYYKNETANGEDFDSIVYDGRIYYVGDEGFFESRFKISEDSNTLTGWYKYKDAVLTKQQEKSFYEVGYLGYDGDGNAFCEYYFLENNITFAVSPQNDGIADGKYGVVRYAKNGNEITSDGTTLILSDNLEEITIEGNAFLTRNEEYTYKYNPTKNETYPIYTNAFYISETTDNIILTFDETIQYDDYFEIPEPFSEMEDKGVEITDNGETITYGGNVYQLVK